MAASGMVVERRALLPHGIGSILLSSACFGVMAVCVHLAALEMGAAEIAFFRFLGSFAVMLAATRGRRLRPQPGNLPGLIFRGLIGAAAITLYFLGIEGVGAGLATLIQNTYPVFAALLAAIFLGETFAPRLAVALLFSLAGVAIVVLGPGASMAEGTVVGALCAAGSAVLAATAVTAVRHLRRSESASLITTYFMGIAAIATLPALLEGLPPLTPSLLFALLGVVVFSIAGQWLLHHGLGFTTTVQGSLTAATSVVTATALEALVFGKAVTLPTLVGAVLMFGAIVLASRRNA
jgi:drug/metabolite transporter (DMT)-like permease